jgi:adenosylcobinamide kinase/adenosylcobinamide-phosphate guanylyltransferase
MDVDACLQSLQREINILSETEAYIFIVTNEIGMGVHAHTEIGRRFTDLQGWANQYIAGIADKVVLMVSGIPVIIKQKKHAL